MISLDDEGNISGILDIGLTRFQFWNKPPLLLFDQILLQDVLAILFPHALHEENNEFLVPILKIKTLFYFFLNRFMGNSLPII